MSTILVIDDDRAVQHMIQAAFRDQPPVTVLAAGTAADGLRLLSSESVDVVLLDVILPDLSGLETFKRVQAIDGKVPVVFITVGGSSETAIEAMKLGGVDYLLKPLDLARVRALVRQALEMRRLMHVPVDISGNNPAQNNGDSIVGRSPQMQDVYKAIGRVAPQNVTVLIRGESGTGKELIARAIYHHSKRADQQFLAVNCAALTDSLLESELFGHEKGAFTGAAVQRVGKFEQSSGGTLFMDEVGDMSPMMQSKVLRVLQDQQFERVGGTQTITTDVRILAATNRDLEQMVADGSFREDLYYRLNGFVVNVVPLRERRQDILPLLECFLAKFKEELNKDIHRFSEDALEMLTKYDWPGNVRQLQSVLKQALVQATGPVLMQEFFPAELRTVGESNHHRVSEENPNVFDLPGFIAERLDVGSHDLFAEATLMMERLLISSVLRRTQGNQSKAAEILGITRGSLRKKIRTLGICIEHIVNVEEPNELATASH